MKNTIGQNISVYRKKAGMTQEELSEIMNVTSQAVSKWENDLSYPDLECVGRLATALNTTVDALINGAESTPSVKMVETDNVEKRILAITTDIRSSHNNVSAKVRIPVELILKFHADNNLTALVGEDTADLVKNCIGLITSGAVGTVLEAHTDKIDALIEVIEYEN